MDDYIELSSESSLENSSSDEDEGSIQLAEVNNNIPSKNAEAQVLSAKDVYKIMETKLKTVCDVTDRPPNETRSLLSLSEIKWDVGKLLEILCEDGKKAKQITDNLKFERCLETIDTCPICCEKLDNAPECFTFRCNHRFCRDCLSDFVTFKVKEEAGLFTNAIKCPAFNCECELDDESVIQGLQSEQLKARYLQVLANNFVQTNRLMTWCPSANCINAIKIPSWMKTQAVHESVRCSCGCWFCFECKAMSHDPVPCSLLTDWEKVKQEDFEVKTWILKNTKQCPKCFVNIEKKGGCMHMTCTKCKHEFCWICFGNWNKHECQPAEQQRAGDFKEFQSVRRFSLYNAKHETMQQSYRLNLEQFQTTTSYGTELELPAQVVKIDFVAAAVELLLQCRRTLMYSYVFSFFMTTIDNQMFIFEENLKFLEQYTEELSEVLENNLTAENWSSVKPNILDRSDKCKNRRRNLLDHIKEGYENNWWRKFPIPLEELQAAQRDQEIPPYE